MEAALKMTSPAAGSIPFSAMDERDLYFSLERLQTHYILCIDGGRLEEWPHFFTEDCIYRIIPRENFDMGLPAPLVYCDNRRMLIDRVTSLRQANIFQPHHYRHIVSGVRILELAEAEVTMESNYVVFQTLQDGETKISIRRAAISTPSCGMTMLFCSARSMRCSTPRVFRRCWRRRSDPLSRPNMDLFVHQLKGNALMNTRFACIAVVAAALVAPAHAADKVKVGLITTLSGANSTPGIEVRDGFNLALKLNQGKLGGLATEVLTVDDQLNPEVAKQNAERLLKRDRVDFLTGIVYSNVLLAVMPVAADTRTFYISPNAGPSQFAGEQCSPYFFAASWQNDVIHEAPGKFAMDRGFNSVFLLSANYAAGKDAMTGFKRYYTRKPAAEVYTALGQLDYSAEISQIRAAKPEAVYFFLPGGMGINFIKQFVAAGLSKDVMLIATGVTSDEDVIRATGDSIIGLFNAAPWGADLDNAANRTFVAAFEKEYGRLPSAYAAQAYDTALMIDAAVRDVKGRLDDKAALQKAFRAARFKSVRGDFKINTNHFPIQSYYLRVIGKDQKGRVTNKIIGTIFTNHADTYASECKMKGL